MMNYDVAIVGGGLAGLTAAIHLAQGGRCIVVIEKQAYPHHKVCGEYVSNEVGPYLAQLGVALESLGAVPIDTLELSTLKGRLIKSKLPLGGLGISRYTLDDTLYKRALAVGVHFIFKKVAKIEYHNVHFKVFTDDNETIASNLVVGAYGKRSFLDRQLSRKFIERKSQWIAVKSHYRYDDFPGNVVALHNFRGGYGGLSKTEKGVVNFCYLTTYESFQRQKSISEFNKHVVSQNPHLAEFLENATALFEEPLTIAQISFEPKSAVVDHVLMCGDTAGLIHPLCGNGMAMAIHSAKIASELIESFLSSFIGSRHNLESLYQKKWNNAFKRRLWMGRRLQALLLNPGLSKIAFEVVTKRPGVVRQLIKNTHGKPFTK